MSFVLRAISVCFLLLFAAAEARAGDTWTTPFAGVRRLHRTVENPRWNINVVEVDLAAPGISLRTTAHGERGRRTSSFASLVGAQVAINGDFYVAGYNVLGLAAGLSAQWPNNSDKNNTGNLAFGDGRVEIYHPSALIAFDPAWMKGVIGGLMAVVWDGVVHPVAEDPLCSARHPRTAVGLSADSKKLYMAVIDGRQPGLSVGMTCGEVGNLMKEVGAHFAINFDGGGSATMYMQNAGIVNHPSDGSERTVANHLAVLAGPAAPTGVLKGVIYAAPDTAARLAGATVKLPDGSTTISSESGIYSFTLPPGTYDVTATKPGFLPGTATKTVTLNTETWNSIGLVASDAADFDSDGVPDGEDNCAEQANADQQNSDDDPLGDACDPDDDNDGIFDEDEPPAEEPECDDTDPMCGSVDTDDDDQRPDGDGPRAKDSGGCSSSGRAALAFPALLVGLALLRRRRAAR